MTTKKNTQKRAAGKAATPQTELLALPLAALLSAVLRHPDLPVRLYNDIMGGINEVYSDSGDERNRLAESPEYIALVLDAYAKGREGGAR